MKKLIGLFLLAFMLAAVITVPGCSKPKSGVLRVGMECNYAPFNWTQPTDAKGAVKINQDVQYAAGYDVEIAKRIAEGLNMELEIVKIAWDGLSPAVESGSIDLIIAGMSPTAERKESIDFTDNYYKSNLVIVVRKDSPYASTSSLADFAGAKIVGQQGTVHADVVSQIDGVIEQDPMGDFSAMRVAIQSGAIDGYVSEKPEGVSASAANADLTYVEFAEGSGFVVTDEDVAVAVGIAKGREDLLGQINDILTGISEDERETLMGDATVNQPVMN